MPKLAYSLNRQVLVIPAFFGDDAPRRCTLIDIEPAGLWFRVDALNGHLSKLEDAAPPDDALAMVFFRFDQIVYGFPAQFAYVARGLSSRGTPTKFEQRTARISRSGHPRDGRSRPKKSKST